MRLILTVTSSTSDNLPESPEKTWSSEGGSIGRYEDNDWVLPDNSKEISRFHGRVLYLDDHFYLEDSSSNGIYINSRQNRMDPSNPHIIRDGERFFIGPYEIAAQLQATSTKQSIPQNAITSRPNPVAAVTPEFSIPVTVDDAPPVAAVQPLDANDYHRDDHHSNNQYDHNHNTLEPARAAMPYAGIHEPAPVNAGVVSISAPSNGQFIPENWLSDPIDDALANWEVPTPEFNQEFDQPFTPEPSVPEASAPAPNFNPAGNNYSGAGSDVAAPTAPAEVNYNPTEQSALAMFSDIISSLSRPERDAVLAQSNGSPDALFKQLYKKHFN